MTNQLTTTAASAPAAADVRYLKNGCAAAPQQRAVAREMVLAQMREEIVSARTADG